MTLTIYSSYFGGLARIPRDLTPVSIARGAPKWFTGRVYLPLAPTWAMLKMTRPDYDRAYDALLAGLDPDQVAKDLGDGAVLLCWERPNIEACHRRRVAEFLEDALRLVVPEWGFPRTPPRPTRRCRRS
jgi:hypothetical protein